MEGHAHAGHLVRCLCATREGFERKFLSLPEPHTASLKTWSLSGRARVTESGMRSEQYVQNGIPCVTEWDGAALAQSTSKKFERNSDVNYF